MQATPTSNIKRRPRIIRVKNLSKGEEAKIQVAVERRNIKRCPAVKLAANRNPSAMGCAIRLSVSISTIIGIRNDGVPCGTKCLSRLLNAR